MKQGYQYLSKFPDGNRIQVDRNKEIGIRPIKRGLKAEPHHIFIFLQNTNPENIISVTVKNLMDSPTYQELERRMMA